MVSEAVGVNGDSERGAPDRREYVVATRPVRAATRRAAVGGYRESAVLPQVERRKIFGC
jgi:hypothetical protein